MTKFTTVPSTVHMQPIDVARFWAKVLRGDGCWLWQASVNRGGYGKFSWRRDLGDGRFKVVTHLAHRIAYELLVGTIPDGMMLRHRCPVAPNILCCNPDHLLPGTALDNSRDMMDAKRGRWLKGESVVNSRLTEADVLAIRQRRSAGESGVALAREFGVSPTTVCAVYKRRNWK